MSTTVPGGCHAQGVGDFRERLWPAWWVWLVLAGLVLLLSWAFGLALGRGAGAVVLVVGLVVVAALLRATAPLVELGPSSLRVGAAVLPLASIGPARTLAPEEVRVLRGPGADARMFTELRPWSASGAVLLEIADAADPHPAWLFSVRHPDRLLDALAATMGTHAQEDS